MATAATISSIGTGVAPKSNSVFLAPKDAAIFYESACRSEGVHIHSTFLKQVLMESVIIQFENGYLGNSGVGPIVQTLQRIPLRALILTKCALTTEDIKQICDGLSLHARLEKIDIRGVSLTIGGAKELLHLVARNPHITEVLMDDSLPKCVAIQQQCSRNARTTYRMQECLICGAAVASNAETSCETQVVRFTLERLKPSLSSYSVAEVRVFCGALQECMDRNNGVLAVCAGVCAESLAEDICRCISSIPKALVRQQPYEAPNLFFLRAYLTREHGRLLMEAEQQTQSQLSSQDNALPKPLLHAGPRDAAEEERWRTKLARTDIDAFIEDDLYLHLPRCTVCGQLAECSDDGPTWLLRVLQKDVTVYGAAVTPVGLQRICRLFTLHAGTQPCSRRCVRHLVRYALFGYGGVNCSYASGYPALSSVLGGHEELRRLPLMDFSLIDVEREVIEDVCAEEINCALTVASAIGDDEGTHMDPYLLFAIGRHLRQQPLRSLGMDLASACEAVRLVGCLTDSDAPFHRQDMAAVPPRDLVADWSTWSSSNSNTTVRRWLHGAFARRRQRVCVVDGPHRDLFDNIRAALWTLRRQPRSVLVTMKFALRWLSLPNGVIESTVSVHTHGFFTSAKAVGQCTRDSTVYLILQCPFGRHAGYQGFFYFPKSVFLQAVRGLAFVFVDSIAPEYRIAARQVPRYGFEMVGKFLGTVTLADLSLLRRFLVCLMVFGVEQKHRRGTLWDAALSSCDINAMRHLISDARLPEPLHILRNALETGRTTDVAGTVRPSQDIHLQRQSRSVHSVAYSERILLSSRFPSQLLYFFSEVVGTSAGVEWLKAALRTLSTNEKQDREGVPSRERQRSLSTTKRGLDMPTFPLITSGERQWIDAFAAPTEVHAPARRPMSSSRQSRVKVESVLKPSTPSESRNTKLETTPSRKRGSASSKIPKPPSRPPSGERKKRSTIPISTNAVPQRRKSSKISPMRKSSPNAKAVRGRLLTIDSPRTSRASSPESRPTSAIDPMRALLREEWAEERAQRHALTSTSAAVGLFEFLRNLSSSGGRSRSRIDSSSLSTTTTLQRDATASGHFGAPGARTSLSSRLLGKPWLVVPLPEGLFHHAAALGPSRTTNAQLLLLFLGDTISVYSHREAQLLYGPIPMSEDPLMQAFPFSTGIDAAVVHPEDEQLVFFFSGSQWLLFDLVLLECVDGPYSTSAHGQFRRLPAPFHDQIDGVLHIPSTRYLVFFRDLCYVVLDVSARRCVGGIGFLNPPSRDAAPEMNEEARTAGTSPAFSSTGMPPALDDLIRLLYPAKSMTSPMQSAKARHGNDGGLDSGDDDEAAKDGTGPVLDGDAAIFPLQVTKTLQAELGTTPVSAFSLMSDDEEGSVQLHFLVSRTGLVIPVQWEVLHENAFFAKKEITESSKPEGSPGRWLLRMHVDAADIDRPLRNLPLMFRQYTCAAFPTLCELAVRMACDLDHPVAPYAATVPLLRLYDPDAHCARPASPHSSYQAGPPGKHSTVEMDDTGGASLTIPTEGTISQLERASDAYVSRNSGAPTVTSSLVTTSLGARDPVALARSRASSAFSAAEGHDSTWRSEVVFYGDAKGTEVPLPPRPENASGHLSITSSNLCDEALAVEARTRISFIEYDLGTATPPRIFAALLLILDTSALPAAVLQLAPLIAFVERSNDGEVFTRQAVLRIDGPITATRWGTGPGCTTVVAARFWRLRFACPVPSSLGVVRLFWMEAMPSATGDADSQTPTMFCPCTPILLTLPSTRHADTGAYVRRNEWANSADLIVVKCEELLQPSVQLVSRDNLYPVFTDNMRHNSVGWYTSHAILPLLGDAQVTRCLFVCDSTLVEVGWDRRGTTVSATQVAAQPIARRVGFQQLPYPFVLGWDAVFYADPDKHPSRVALLRNEWMLLWDLQEQKALSEVLPWRESALLSQLTTIPIARIVCIINCWSDLGDRNAIGVFHIPSSLSGGDIYYVEYDLAAGMVIGVPVSMHTWMVEQHNTAPPLSGSVLHAVLCCPNSPSEWYLFWDRGVQRVCNRIDPNDAAGDASDFGDIAEFHCLSESRLFYSVPLYLREWGKPQHHCSVLLNIPQLLTSVHGETGEGLIITGMQLYSAGGQHGESSCWEVQCSEKSGSGWKDVAMHRQGAGGRVFGETLWTPTDAYSLSKCPYWRWSRVAFSRDADTDIKVAEDTNVVRSTTQSYSQLRVMAVPRRRCRQVPKRISNGVEGTSVENIQLFFSGGTAKVEKLTFAACRAATSADASVVTGSVVYELLWDYGASPVALCSIAFRLRDEWPQQAECIWTVWCRNTAMEPERCSAIVTKLTQGKKDGEGGMCTLSWLPDGTYRFWRLQCVWREARFEVARTPYPPTLTIYSFYTHEYDGPLLVMCNTGSANVGATPLLWPLANPSASPYVLHCTKNSALQIFYTSLDMTLWEIEYLPEGTGGTSRIAIEYTDDSARWLTASEMTICTATNAVHPEVCTFSWPNQGAHVIWRMRVLQSSVDVSLRLVRVRLGHCSAATHITLSPSQLDSEALMASGEAIGNASEKRGVSAPRTISPGSPEVSVLAVMHPTRFVRVRALLPDPLARYSVEYLGLDGASWLPAAILKAESGASPSCATVTFKVDDSIKASVSWDGALVTPSTQWRLRRLPGITTEWTPALTGAETELQCVEWFALSADHAEMIDTADIPGMGMSVTGFAELQPVAYLSGSSLPAATTVQTTNASTVPSPVLSCVLGSLTETAATSKSESNTVTWSFITPLLLDQLLVSVVVSTKLKARPPPTETTTGEESTEDSAFPPPSPPPDQLLYRVLVETSETGEDYVAVAADSLRLCDETLSLRWFEVPPSAFWRLRLIEALSTGDGGSASEALPFTFTVDVYAARWMVRRGAPALFSEVTGSSLGYYSNTIYRAWISDLFNCEDHFIRTCQAALDEYTSTQTRLRESNDISRLGQVAGAIQKLKAKYQTFLQKTAKEAGKRMPRGSAVVNADGEEAKTPQSLELLSPTAPPQVAQWLSERQFSSDIIHFLVESSVSAAMGGPHFLRLVELLHHPLAFRQPTSFSKRSSRWFYPSLETVGPIAEDFYGFPAADVYASLCVFWSLSTALQRRLDILLATPPVITALSEHIASPLVVVQVNAERWRPHDHFPAIASLLYAVGFEQHPTTMVFAVNDVVFTPPYAMGIPGTRDSQPLVSPFPYTIAPGINFIQQRPLSQCPAPILDVLRLILPPSAFAKDAKGNPTYLSTLVLTVDSLQETPGVAPEHRFGVLRFTVPGAGVNFGIENLEMNSLEFEVIIKAKVPSATGAKRRHRLHQINFVSHGARFTRGDAHLAARMGLEACEEPGKACCSVPVSILGCGDCHGLPVVGLQGLFGNWRFSHIAELPGAVVTHLKFKTVANIESVPAALSNSSAEEGESMLAAPHWVFSPIHGEGQVFLPGVSRGCVCSCTIDSTCGEGDSPVRLYNFYLAMDRCSVHDLLSLSQACAGGPRPLSHRYQLSEKSCVVAGCDQCGMQVEVTILLRALSGLARTGAAHLSLKGKALLWLENTVLPNASLEIDCGTGLMSLSAQCVHPISLGALVMEGDPQQRISVQLVRVVPQLSRLDAPNVEPVNSISLRMMIAGHAHIFGVSRACRVTLEISQSVEGYNSVTVFAESLRHPGLDMVLQDCMISKVWRYGQVVVNESELRCAMQREVSMVPVIANLQAHQIPLALTLSSVTPQPYDLVTRRLSCRMKGFLYGTSFDVVASVIGPDDVEDIWNFLSSQAVPEIVEQCEASLWASYANVIGLRSAGDDMESELGTPSQQPDIEVFSPHRA